MKLKPNGDTLWTRTYESGGDDEAGDVAIDQFGNVVVTGTAVVGDSVRCVILEYADSGGVIRKSAFGKNAMATGNGLYITKDSDIFITRPPPRQAAGPAGGQTEADQRGPRIPVQPQRPVGLGTPL